jgi:hypothetical protein
MFQNKYLFEFPEYKIEALDVNIVNTIGRIDNMEW